MTDFLYPDILNEQLTYARQARAAWLWTNVAERSRIFLQVLDTLQPICASLARDSVQETGYGIFEDRMLIITRLLRDLRSCCLQTESPFSERLSCTDTHTQSQPSGTLLGIPSSIHPVTETLFAAAIAIQTGNPLIFFFSDSAFQISARTASLQSLSRHQRPYSFRTFRQYPQSIFCFFSRMYPFLSTACFLLYPL